MVERRPLLDIVSHLTLILGVAVIAFPLYVAFVASTQTAQEVARAPMSLIPGAHFLDNYWSVLKGGAINTPPVGRMLWISTFMALAIAIASATYNAAAGSGVVAMGEIGLAGELRRVRDLPQRLAEAARLGFRVAIVPGDRARNRPRVPENRTVEGMRVVEVPDVAAALRQLHLTSDRHGLRAVDD